MVESIRVPLDQAGGGLGETALYYGMLERLSRSTHRLDLDLLAFGIGADEVRLVVDGTRDGVSNLLRGMKVGTARAAAAWDMEVAFSRASRERCLEEDLAHAVAWAHQAPVAADGPLASPWSSHRDLLGYRHASFFDAAPVLRRVDPAAVHALAGGDDLPRPRPGRCRRESLCMLLRVAGALLGVLPADRRSFRLFVHLARERGWNNPELADALMLTRRRIRQLAEGAEPLLPTARLYLTDARLGVVP